MSVGILTSIYLGAISISTFGGAIKSIVDDYSHNFINDWFDYVSSVVDGIITGFLFGVFSPVIIPLFILRKGLCYFKDKEPHLDDPM